MRVLVVEDETAIADFLVRGLAEHGYAVDLARDGAEALDLLQAASVNVVVLDILLPKVDGLAVCRRMRERGDRTPVLMLTARDAVEDRVRGLDTGADDYLVKPSGVQAPVTGDGAGSAAAARPYVAAIVVFVGGALALVLGGALRRSRSRSRR